MTVEVIKGILIPFLRTSAGAGCVFFMRGKIHPLVQRALIGFASGVMVAASIWRFVDTGHGTGDIRRYCKGDSGSSGFWFGILFLLLLDHVIPHLHMNSEEAEGLERARTKITAYDHAGAGCDPSQYSGRNGSGRGLCRMDVRGDQHHSSWSSGAISGNCHSELSRGSDHFPSIKSRRHEEGEGICLRGPVWCGGTHRGISHHTCSRTDHTGTSVSVKLCSGSHDVCGGGGTDSGNVRGTSFGYWYSVVRIWIYFNACIGCSSWMMQKNCAILTQKASVRRWT